MSTCIIASIRAMSVPGGGWTNSSADSAVIVRIGSMTTTLGAVGACRLDGRPEVAVGEAGVRPPQQDQPAVAQLERVEAEAAAVGHAHAVADRRAADRPVEEAGAEVVEEAAVEAGDRQQALVAGVAERQHRLGAVAVDDVVQAARRSRRGRRPT